MDTPAGSPRYRCSDLYAAALSHSSLSARPLMALLGSAESRTTIRNSRNKSTITTQSENQENSSCE